ncbi:MAG TPA: hypothetical protein VL094_02120 [Sphingomonadaceae bacterium]|nr:hypothetical protein [Sphingomonadaceae bacterium]
MGGHSRSRWPKIVAGAAILAIFLAPIAYANSGRAKQRYFDITFNSCSRSEGLDGTLWRKVPVFDGEVREFVASDAREAAVIDCANRWAGLFISDHLEPKPGDMPMARSKLTVSVAGSNYAPPEHLVDIAHVEFTGGNDE